MEEATQGSQSGINSEEEHEGGKGKEEKLKGSDSEDEELAVTEGQRSPDKTEENDANME